MTRSPVCRTVFINFFGTVLFLLACTAAGIGYTLTLAHDSDDEMIYTALAAKISARGLGEYNLRDLSIQPQGDFWRIEYQKDGNLLALLTQTGASYYDTGLFFNPPLYPLLLLQ